MEAKKEFKLSPETEKILEEIKNTGKSWYEKDVPDHPLFPQFARKLVVTGFNTPEMEGEEDRIYLSVQQILTLKKENRVYKSLPLPTWRIDEKNAGDIIGKNGALKAKYVVKDERGKIVEKGEEIVKVQSVQYVRYLIKNKELHWVEILEQFMKKYMEIFDKELNEI